MTLNQTKANSETDSRIQPIEKSEDHERYYATAMSVRFTSYQERVACGDVSTLYLGKTFHFHGLDHLLLIMEDMMDYIRTSCPAVPFPQAFCDHRSLKVGKTGTTFQEVNEEVITQFESPPAQKKTGAHIAAITVYYRQHASMQGELRTAGRKVFFRSGLELMRLLHQALEHAAKETKKFPRGQ